jgi:serine/threonine kinase 38
MKNDLNQLVKSGKIEQRTLDRVQIAKSYIEKKYRMKQMKEEEKKKEWEIFNKRLEELNLSFKEKDLIKKDALHREAEFLRLT